MSFAWKSLLALYNLLLIAISIVMAAVALGDFTPLYWIAQTLTIPLNKWIIGAAGIVLAFLGVILMFKLFQREKTSEIVVKDHAGGKVTITIPAIKQIILKAVKQVEGVREIKPEIKNGTDGVIVTLTLLVNPDYKVPEMTTAIQDKVKALLEEVGGVQVAEVRIRVDDFASKSVPN
ncbi:MAG: alkaline shock response membrane anchor protein AmaP [Syntrophomonadaceae bacterium]|nr:alkaline shock response membrane anchor protein AmaP [Syntrophomonadaceae bacterium]